MKLDSWRREFSNIFLGFSDSLEGLLAQLSPALRGVVHAISNTLQGYVAARTSILSSSVEPADKLEASALRAFAYDIIERPHSGLSAENHACTPLVVDESAKKTLDSMISNREIGTALLFAGESFASNRYPSQEVDNDLLVYWSLCVEFRNIADTLWKNRLKATIHGEMERRGVEMIIPEPYIFDNSQWMARLIDMESFWSIRDCLGTSVLHVLLQEIGRRRSQGIAQEPPGLAKRIATHCQRPDHDPADRSGRSAIHIATQHNLPDIIQALISAGLSLDRRTFSGRTALHFAAALGYSEVCKALAHHGKDVNCVDRYARAPLHYACRLGHVDAVKVLLRHPNIIVNQQDRDGDTPLMAALRSERTRRPPGRGGIHEHGNSLWEAGSTWRSLTRPAEIGSGESAYKELVRHPSVNFNLANGRGETALHIAVLQNDLGAVQKLAFGCAPSINATDIEGRTALCCAAQRDSDGSIVRILLQVNSIDSKLPDRRGKTPLDYARSNNNFKAHVLINAQVNKDALAKYSGEENSSYDVYWEEAFRTSLTTTGPFRVPVSLQTSRHIMGRA